MLFQIVETSGWMGYVLVGLGLLGVVLLIERLVAYHRESTDYNTFKDEFAEAISVGDFARAAEICDSYRGHGPEVYRLAVEYRARGPATVRTILHNHIDLTVLPRLRARLRALNAIAKGAPMIGLLGTVYGMFGAFETIAGAQGQGVDPKALAGNIGLALGTTILGLFVAIPIVFASSYLRAKVDQFETDLERYTDYCLDLLYPALPQTIATTPPSAPKSPSPGV
jgi:biopolymer transport protein ExbB/TolQ